MMRRLALISVLVLGISQAVPGLAELTLLPDPDLEGLEPRVAAQLSELRELAGTVVGNALASTADKAKAWSEMGQVYHAYGLLAAAEACYSQAEAMDLENETWPYMRGHVALGLGDLEAAAVHFARTLGLAPSNAAAMVHLADVHVEFGRRAEARVLLEQAAQISDQPVIRARLGELALADGQFEAAVRLLEEALAAVPQATRLHHPLGMAYRGSGDVARAREHLAKRGAVGLAPIDPLLAGLQDLKVGERVHLLRGRSAFQAGSFAEAVEEFGKAVEERPDSGRARVNLSAALTEVGDVEGALKQLEIALALDPDNATARFNLGSLLASGGRHPEAIGQFAAVTEVSPEDEEAWLAEARSWIAIGDFPRATARLSLGNSKLPASGRIAFALARLLAAAPDLTVRDGQRALDLAVRVFEAQRTAQHAVLVSQALGELGRCDELGKWLDGLIQEARANGATDELAVLETRAAELAAAESCRP